MEAAAPPSLPGPRPWWETRWFVAAMILAAVIPLAYPPVPPLVDLLGHMGRYTVQLDLASSPELQRFYAYDWHLIGNLGVDILVIPLSKLFGLEMAVKLIAMSIPPLTVGGFLWVAREVHNRLPPTAAFALPFAIGHPFLFGFVNFTLSMALAFLAFGLWLRLGRLGRTTLRLVLFVPISFVLFFCHTFGWGTLGLLAFSAEAVRQHDKGVDWWKAALSAALHAVVMAGPVVVMLTWRSTVQSGGTADWFNLPAKASWIMMSLRDRWQWFDFACVAALLAVIVEARRRPELTFSRNLAFSALVLLAGFMILPRIVFGSAYADMRLAPFMIATAILAIRFRTETVMPLARKLAVLAVGFYALRIVATTISLAMASNDQEAKLDALDHVPRGVALVSLVGQECKALWALPRNTHLPAMALVRRHAFSNDQWTVEGANLLSVRYKAAGHFTADPSQIVRPAECESKEAWAAERALAAIPKGVFDYVWLVDVPPIDPRLVDGMTPVWRGPGSLLYAIGKTGDQPKP
ncbi:hypothetical protein [Sphingomonas alba]|uniref:Glycosyltransferase RgtA/B/C/D-like domain-containing protein n=1 Tax=Sphingomonas alba TaxID=2908208 RepID=A0ABT0RM67_9SPHN|nr:hypothetical protein [Sphingomonas alba]MCL6683739.1 hypothetical protein [Sphingomonas alba]